MKKKSFNQRIKSDCYREVFIQSFVFTTSGGMAPESTKEWPKTQLKMQGGLCICRDLLEQSSDLTCWGAPLLQYEAFKVKEAMFISRIS